MEIGHKMKQGMHRAIVGQPIEELRRSLPKRKETKPLKPWVKFLAIVTFLWFAAASVVTFFQLLDAPGDMTWWTMQWVWGAPAVGAGLFVFNLVPRTARVTSYIGIAWILGSLAVPLMWTVFASFHVVVLVLAVLFGVPFLSLLNHYVKAAQLHQEGLLVP